MSPGDTPYVRFGLPCFVGQRGVRASSWRHLLRMNRPALHGLPFGDKAEAEGVAGGGHVGGAEGV